MTVTEPIKLYQITAAVYGVFMLLWAIPYLFSVIGDIIKFCGTRYGRARVLFRRQIDHMYRKNLTTVCPRKRSRLMVDLVNRTAFYGILFALKDAILHPYFADLAHDMSRAAWWTTLGNDIFAQGREAAQTPVIWYVEITLLLVAAWLFHLYRVVLRYLKKRRERNQKVERMILLVLDSANNIVGKAKGLRSWVPQSGFYGHAEIADMLLNAKDVDLDVRIYLMDFYMTDLEKQLPEGREKDDILFALRPAWEQLVEENK